MKNKSKPKKPPVVKEITSDEEDENEVLTKSEEEVNMNFVEEFEEMEQDLENLTKQSFSFIQFYRFISKRLSK
ncbi:hypothetical protein RN001_001721 [Aquatica leii]|uniref:Uncharacterized protein n=1 Tax=Aquatica leii TaxID=1421715 RepID=A0AAN7SSP6_9COLE|nr:hypothetical protein RN001_001721 [Aquatica leii]